MTKVRPDSKGSCSHGVNIPWGESWQANCRQFLPFQSFGIGQDICCIGNSKTICFGDDCDLLSSNINSVSSKMTLLVSCWVRTDFPRPLLVLLYYKWLLGLGFLYGCGIQRHHEMPFALPPTCWRHVEVSLFGASSMIYHTMTSQSIPFLFYRRSLLIITVIWITYIKSGKGKGKKYNHSWCYSSFTKQFYNSVLSLYAYFNEAFIIKIFILNLTIRQICFSNVLPSYDLNTLDA